MGASSKGDASLVTDINVTPLVDVVLVLLVVMMVTATAVANKTIALQLPKAGAAESAESKAPLVVGVDAKGGLFLGTEPADETSIRARARSAVAANKEAAAVLAADGQARHEAVVHAMDLLRGERVTKIAIVVRSEGAR
jgi:biopolymer transport protein ExbD